MPGKSTYRHVARSITSSTDTVPATGEGSGAIDNTTSRFPTGGGGAESSSVGTITTSAPLEPAPAGGSNAAWRAVVSATICSSSTVAAVTRGGGAPESSTVVARADPSSTCTVSGLTHGGWGQGLEGTTRALWAKRFRGAKLSTLVSACLREDIIEVSKQSK
jgi:hypothetical protein